MSDTPRTDALTQLLATGRHPVPDDDAYRDLALKLERELNEFRNQDHGMLGPNA